MAFPVILIDSATGSDTAASGAGPSTALTGSASSTNAAGTLVTLDGSPDLTDVATDGSHVIFLNDTTAGARNFGKITAKDNGAKTVTVSNAFGASLSGKGWAIGGKRSAIGTTLSRKLIENNGGSGDWMPGWIIELASGHTETITARLNFRRDGDETNGPVWIRGASGTKPVITCNQADYIAQIYSSYFRMDSIQFRNIHASATYGLVNTGSSTLIRDVTLGGGTSYWQNDGLYMAAGGGNQTYERCDVSECRYGVFVVADTPGSAVIGCHIHDNNNHGFNIDGPSSGHIGLITDNLIVNNGGDGIRISLTTSVYRGNRIVGNTISGNTGDGIEIQGNGTGLLGTLIQGNQLTSNGGYGINFTTTPATVPELNSNAVRILNNNHYSNTSGWCNLTLTDVESGTTNLDPQYVGSGNYTPQNTSLKGAAFPASINGATNYEYPGAIQPNASSGLAPAPLVSPTWSQIF